MTNDEAIYILFDKVFPCVHIECHEALNMAIIALQMKSISEKELETAYIKGKTDGIKECTKELQKMIGR